MTAEPRIRVRVQVGDEPLFGPGKASVLRAIARTGSISGAARRLGMSYRRAWLLVDAMNRDFVGRVVEAESGGAQGGGARLTPLGDKVLSAYANVERDAQTATERSLARLRVLLRDDARGPGEPA